jgi:hypothetical protein
LILSLASFHSQSRASEFSGTALHINLSHQENTI